MGKEKKDKKDKKEQEGDKMDVESQHVEKEKEKEKDEVSYEQRCLSVSVIAHPLASKKLTKKTYKTIKKAAKAKAVKRGVKEVIKGLRKGAKGLVVIAGDISPIDVITHIPVLCEENDVPYIYAPSKQDLGASSNTKRPTSVVMIVAPSSLKNKDTAAEYKDSYDDLSTEVKELNEKMITVA
ncbi:snoRNA-binding protein [Physocladia obscura]|uniref:H/ACA ribonucleoprotein complex subunit 2 n=1 Tax=Physocladia obscura TaxID=109957 RepID=A0AAD5T3C5_9FUNG|nr:snoRNA-binding protein [Physocladia obscura]